MDFQREYRIDLHEYVRGERPWAQFLRFAAILPTASRYKNKLLKDRELARLFPEGSDSVDVDLDFVDETPVVTALRSLQDQLNHLIWVTAGNPKAKIPAPVPRPRSAAMVLREEAVAHQVDDMVLRLTGQSL